MNSGERQFGYRQKRFRVPLATSDVDSQALQLDDPKPTSRLLLESREKGEDHSGHIRTEQLNHKGGPSNVFARNQRN